MTEMKHYMLSIYQPDGDPPPPEVLEPIMRDIDAVNDEMTLRSAGRARRRWRAGCRSRSGR